MLGTDEMRAWYGPDHVILAAERGAIGTLLITDELFRWENFSSSTRNNSNLAALHTHSASDPVLRKKFVGLVENVREKGAEVLIFSSMHESGQRECLCRGSRNCC